MIMYMYVYMYIILRHVSHQPRLAATYVGLVTYVCGMV